MQELGDYSYNGVIHTNCSFINLKYMQCSHPLLTNKLQPSFLSDMPDLSAPAEERYTISHTYLISKIQYAATGVNGLRLFGSIFCVIVVWGEKNCEPCMVLKVCICTSMIIMFLVLKVHFYHTWFKGTTRTAVAVYCQSTWAVSGSYIGSILRTFTAMLLLVTNKF
jgi:hypothetical protein